MQMKLHVFLADLLHFQSYHVHGIEFTWEKLQDKVGFSFLKNDKGGKRIIISRNRIQSM